MVQLLKIGHVEFEVDDLPRMAEHYAEVVGLTVTGRDANAVYLSCLLDHHAVVLRKGSQTRLTNVGFEVAPGDGPAALAKEMKEAGLTAEVRTDSGPGVRAAVRTADPAGTAIDLYSEPEVLTHPYSGRGANPVKLSHVAMLAPDVKKSVAFYTDALGMRFSDSMKEFFYFLRLGCDHHTVNLLDGEHAGLNHVAFEMIDFAHVRAGCDALGRSGVPLLWGPLRHGIGHNIAAYHQDPAGQVVEFCAELDRMSNEGLGYFDPRPWHTDFPQRPKVWEDTKAGTVVWGTVPPPPAMGKGGSKAAARRMGG